MSTRSQVLVSKDNDIVYNYYHHCDGYPEGVGNELFALISTLKNSAELSKKPLNGFNKLIQSDQGYEIEDLNSEHMDIEYLYLVDLDNLTVGYYAIYGKHENDEGLVWDKIFEDVNYLKNKLQMINEPILR